MNVSVGFSRTGGIPRKRMACICAFATFHRIDSLHDSGFVGRRRRKKLRRTVKRVRGGLIFKAPGLLYHSTLGLRAIKRERERKREVWDLIFRVFVAFVVLFVAVLVAPC